MAYLHCHSCDFSQDDFWSETYNPVKSFQDDLKDPFFSDLDRVIGMDSGWLENNGYEYITHRGLILHHLKQIASRIKGMVYRTMEEYQEKNPERICPVCGKRDLDID